MSFLRITDTRLMQLDPAMADVAVKEGAKNVAYVPLTSASLSTSNCNFNLNNIGSNVCRSRRQCLRLNGVTFTLNVTAVAAGPLFNLSGLGYRSWPLNRCISTLSHQINGASYSINLNSIIDSITKFNLESENANFYDNTSYDVTSNYVTVNGTALNPLEPYTNSPLGNGVFKPRTNNITINTNTLVVGSNTIVITCNLYEPLCSPFNNIGKSEDHSLYGINGETINIQWVNDLFNNMLSVVYSNPSNVTINSVTTSFPSTAVLDCVYLTPNENFLNEIPRKAITHYNNYSVFSSDIGAFNAGRTLSVTSQVCQFTGMPFKILIYARQSDSARNAAIPDRYLQIANVQSCTIDNGSNQLSSASIDQLYEISNRNGCVLDRDVWKQLPISGPLTTGVNQVFGCGSILALDPKFDLGISENISDSSGGRFVFQITLNLINNTLDDYAGVTLYVIAVNNAILMRNETEYTNGLYVLPNNAISMSKEMNSISHYEFQKAQNANMFLSGGSFKSFFSKVWNGLKKAGKWVYDNRKEIADGIKLAANVAKTVGLGENYENMDGGYNKTYGYSSHPQKHHVKKHTNRSIDLFYQ